MRMKILAVLMVAAGVLLFAGCRPKTGGSQGPAAPAGSAASGAPVSEGTVAAVPGFSVGRSGKSGTPLGTWYEQAEGGGVLEVTKSKLRYRRPGSDYVFEEAYHTEHKDGETLLVTEDEWGFVYVDISYEKAEDRILAHTMPHTDGDGGWHLIEFCRTKYVAPPPPTYPAPDNVSDPDAQKDFKDLTLSSMKVRFYDPGVYHDPSWDTAPEPPYADEYSYDLTVQPDGTALVSSSYCREIVLSKEKTDELQELFRSCELGSINGLDIHTKGVPADSPDYDAEFQLQSGEVIRSSANWDNVPENWTRFQEPMHHLLFFAFVDAGYNYQTRQFHSTEPMKRVGYASEDRKDLGIKAESVRIRAEWPKAYDYSLDTQYPVFSGGEEYPALMQGLNQLSAEYRKVAETEMKREYEEMQAVPKEVWSKVDRRYSYSLYAPEQFRNEGPFVSFLISEGQTNSLGIGTSGYGHYYNTLYHLDVETGRPIPVSDLFVSPEAIYDYLLKKMRSEFGTHNETGKFVHSDAFAEKLMSFLTGTGRQGIGFSVRYDHLDLWLPTELFTMNDSDLWETVYYDDMQDILGDRYTAVW